MPFISEAASAIKNRLGFREKSDSVRGTPNLGKSAPRDNLSQHSAIRSIGEFGDDSRGDTSSSALAVRSFELPENPTFWKDHNVQVIIRVRPLSASEISLHGPNKCIKQESHQTITWTGHPESRFTFDVVADENVTQEKLFKVAGVPMVENCVGGYNSCVFAYGQTGSGKTHTMLGDVEGGTRRHSVNSGMTPRVFEYLFTRIQKEKDARREEKLRFTCKCSFLEIYNEQILDLLNPSSVNLQIREDLKKGVYVENLTEVEVQTAREAMQQLLEGATNRKVAATNMNHASSRSHSVFTCVIESSWESQGVTHHRFARLNLVDLAGSERQKSSGAEGERLKEATNINKSLSTLGLVIMNLVSISNGKTQHVPYRDSKLTFLLQDSLGGNSKTCIIANISPSNSCSLETLSTLKFAQRAKFIKNNAIINEDASGDVIAMRMQIQQLKKEVSRLRGLTGGAESAESDSLSMGLLGSPGTFKWEGLGGGMFSPFTSDNRLAQKKEFEVALVGAFRREKDKDHALQALTAENQAAMQLAKQREDEIQGLKMRLRFRESAVKRLEAVVSGKISAETYLLKEREEHLKEIEVLRSQVDRNQEVTRFAMENLRLKEEIKRLKSFCEEGERERMNDQIMILENKLLEALDWKLMHESNSALMKKGSPGLISDDHGKSSPLASNKEMQSPWQSSMADENEFLRMQAIQNQSEMDLLRKKLDKCLDGKQKLERQVKDLEAHVEEMRVSKTVEENPKTQIGLHPPSREENLPITSLNDQTQLEAMVDAIAVASQREAEAHEMKVTLSRENDELRTRIMILIEDNNKLIELYERAAAELKNKSGEANGNCNSNAAEKIQDLEHQLMDMREENEKLMNLYEKAMHERDELREALSARENSAVEDRSEFDCQEKLVAVDVTNDVSEVKDTEKVQDLENQLIEMREENEKLMGLYEKAMHERDDYRSALSAARDHCDVEDIKEFDYPEKLVQVDKAIDVPNEKAAEKIQYLEHQLLEMREENEKLLTLYEKAMHERDELRGALSVAREHNEVEGSTEFECLEKLVEVDGGKFERRTTADDKKDHSSLLNEPLLSKAELTPDMKISPIQSTQTKQAVVRIVELKYQTEYSGDISKVKNTEAEKIQYLEHQLMEKRAENEKLIGLYEKAMQEWDEFRKTPTAADENKDLCSLLNRPLLSEAALTKYMQVSSIQSTQIKQAVEEVDFNPEEPLVEAVKALSISDSRIEGQSLILEDYPSDEQVPEESSSAAEIDRVVSLRMELDKANEKLSCSSQTVEQLSLMEKSVLVVDELSRQIDSTSSAIQANQQELESLKLHSQEMHERRECIDKKICALKFSMSNISSSLAILEQREVRARARVYASAVYQNQLQEKLSSLQDQKSEIEFTQRRMEETEAELRSNLAGLKSKVEEENRRQESEKVLFAIDNIERVENWKPAIKATDLLKSQEEKTKLQSEIKLCREKLGVIIREIDHSRSRSQKLENDIQRVCLELRKTTKVTEEMEQALAIRNDEQHILLQLTENGMAQVDEMILAYQECTFRVSLNKEVRDLLEEELQQRLMNLEKMQKDRTEVTRRMTELVDGRDGCLVSEEMRKELEDVVMTLHQAKMLLVEAR